MPILHLVETPDTPTAPRRRPRPPEWARPAEGLWAAGRTMSWVAGLVLALSSFMDWYAGSSVEGPTLGVIGWHTGTLGKLVFFIGLLVVALAILEEVGAELPA